MNTESLLRIIEQLKKENEELIYQLELMHDKLEYANEIPKELNIPDPIPYNDLIWGDGIYPIPPTDY